MPDTPWTAGRLGRGPGRPTVLFGWSYEDERVELDAFGPPGHVLVIAAAGETAAACATAGHRVTAIDVNPVQLAYARARVEDGAPAVRGAAERGMAAGRRWLALLDPAWRGLADDPERWRPALGRRSTGLLLAGALRPGAVLARLLRPEFAAFLPPRFDVTLRQRIAAGLDAHEATRFGWRLLAGVEQPGWALPAPLQPIEWRCADVLTHLETVAPGTYTGISLSNVTDGAPAEWAGRLRAAARRALAPGGALVSRSFVAGPVDAPEAALLWGTVAVERAQPTPHPFEGVRSD